MMTRLIVPAILGAVMLSAPVMAGSTTHSDKSSAPAMQKAAAMTVTEKCSALERQFDAAIKQHESAAKAADARNLRAEGSKLCSSGKQTEGIAKLESALKDLGVTPKV